MIDAMEMLDDVAFAKAMLAKKALSGADLVFSLRNLLRMKYYPVAVKFFFSQEELDNLELACLVLVLLLSDSFRYSCRYGLSIIFRCCFCHGNNLPRPGTGRLPLSPCQRWC